MIPSTLRNLLLFTAFKMSLQIIYQHIRCDTKCKSHIILSYHRFNLLLFPILICNTLKLKTHACLQGKAPPKVSLYLYIKSTLYHLNQYKVQISLFDFTDLTQKKEKLAASLQHMYILLFPGIFRKMFLKSA